VGTPETTFLGIVREIVFLGKAVKERSRWISAMPSEQFGVKSQF